MGKNTRLPKSENELLGLCKYQFSAEQWGKLFEIIWAKPWQFPPPSSLWSIMMICLGFFARKFFLRFRRTKGAPLMMSYVQCLPNLARLLEKSLGLAML
jgi:hypothetical protein